MMDPDQLSFLRELLRRPTAPFREQSVRDFATAALDAWRVPWFLDPAGNLVVGVQDARAYRALLARRGREPVRLFIAHMDHPGFHGVRWLGERRLAIRWHGGSPVKHLNGARVWLAQGDDYLAEGRLRRIRIHPKGYAMERAEVQLPAGWLDGGRRPGARSIYGGLGFRSPVWQGGRRLYTKAADDLVGVFCILQTARELFSGRRRVQPFIGLLSRAEEVGFVGAIAHLQLGWLKRRGRGLIAISLEASRTLPGAEIGRGPIVRLGDRRTVFDPDALQVATELANGLLDGRFQRRIMDGGSCEATATTAYGLPTLGLTVPLGNYHNQGFEGGPDCERPMGPAPEFVHIEDVAGMLTLCQGLMRRDLAWSSPWDSVRDRLQHLRAEHQGLLDRYR